MAFQTVLIVAPEHDTRVTLRQIFETEGHFVVSSGTGSEALMMLEKMSAPSILFVATEALMMSGENFILTFHSYIEYARIPAVQIKTAEGPNLPGICATLIPPFVKESVLETLQHCD